MARKDINLSDKTWKVLRDQCATGCTNENAVKARVRTTMLQVGAMDIGGAPTGGLGKVSGVADQRWLFNGTFIAIEVKWDVYNRGGPTAIQSQYLKDIEAQGGIGLVIDRNNLTHFEQQLDARKSWFFLNPEGTINYNWLHHSWCAKEIIEVTI